MPLAPCRRCKGSGHYFDPEPQVPGMLDWCAGCGGDGYVDVKDPSVACVRCHGTGIGQDQNPKRAGVLDWCDACKGSGYAS